MEEENEVREGTHFVISLSPSPYLTYWEDHRITALDLSFLLNQKSCLLLEHCFLTRNHIFSTANNLLITLQNPTEMLLLLPSLHPTREHTYPPPLLLQDACCSQPCSCACHRALSVLPPQAPKDKDLPGSSCCTCSIEHRGWPLAGAQEIY